MSFFWTFIIVVVLFAQFTRLDKDSLVINLEELLLARQSALQ